ncbi:MAG: AsmA family protein, partial [Gammaproteobacteria bacterium]
MKTILKVFGVIFGLLLVLCIGAVLYISTLDPNDYKAQIAESFYEETGRSLTIDGDIAISIYPWLGLEINRVTVGNAAGFGDQPFFQADHAMLRVKLMPLLREQYEVDTVRLHGAIINLQKNPEGITNWADLAGGAAESDRASDSAGLPLAAVILGGVDIRDANLSWDDQSTGVRYDINNLVMTTGELIYGQPIDVNMTLQASANKPEIAADVGLAGTINYEPGRSALAISPLQLTTTLTGPNVPDGTADVVLTTAIAVNLDDETLSVSDLDFTALGTRLSGTVNATNIRSSTPSWQSQLTLAGTDLSVLFKLAEIEPLATQLAGMADRSFDLTAAVDADMEGGDLEISGLDANLLGSNIRGDIQAANIQTSTPIIRGTLNGTGPDLPALMQVAGQLQGGSDATLTRYGRQLGRVSGRNFVVDINFDA